MRSLSLYTAAMVVSCSRGIMVHHPEMDDPSKDYSCGRDWVSASIGCHKHCASGDDNDCADLGVGWGCYIFTGVSFIVHIMCSIVFILFKTKSFCTCIF